jgi:hypothetical protein
MNFQIFSNFNTNQSFLHYSHESWLRIKPPDFLRIAEVGPRRDFRNRGRRWLADVGRRRLVGGGSKAREHRGTHAHSWDSSAWPEAARVGSATCAGGLATDIGGDDRDGPPRPGCSGSLRPTRGASAVEEEEAGAEVYVAAALVVQICGNGGGGSELTLWLYHGDGVDMLARAARVGCCGMLGSQGRRDMGSRSVRSALGSSDSPGSALPMASKRRRWRGSE